MSKTDYDKAMLPSWHSFEEYNLCVKGHVQQRLLTSCSQYLFCVYGRHYTNTKKNTRVKSTTYSGLGLIQMLLCTLHSADVRVELIKDADTLFELDDFIPNQRKRKSVTSTSTAYSLRGTNILSLPKPSTTTYGLNSFSYSSVKYWNSLPDHFRKTVDYSEFKRKLLVHGFS